MEIIGTVFLIGIGIFLFVIALQVFFWILGIMADEPILFLIPVVLIAILIKRIMYG